MPTLLEKAVAAISDPGLKEQCLAVCHAAVLDQMLGLAERSLPQTDHVAESNVCSRMALALREHMTPTKPIPNFQHPPTTRYIAPPTKKP